MNDFQSLYTKAAPGELVEITLRPGQSVQRWVAENVTRIELPHDLDIPPSPVQQHVDAVIDDLVQGRLNPIQRGMVKRALDDSAVGDLARGRCKAP